jgi:hypothetical protein
MAIMFTKDARFADLKRKLEVVKQKKSKLLTIFVFLVSMSGFRKHTTMSMMLMGIMITTVQHILLYCKTARFFA